MCHLFIYFSFHKCFETMSFRWIGSVWFVYFFAWLYIQFENGWFCLFLITADTFISVSNGFMLFHSYCFRHLRCCEDACAFPPRSFQLWNVNIFGSMAPFELKSIFLWWFRFSFYFYSFNFLLKTQLFRHSIYVFFACIFKSLCFALYRLNLPDICKKPNFAIKTSGNLAIEQGIRSNWIRLQ